MLPFSTAASANTGAVIRVQPRQTSYHLTAGADTHDCVCVCVHATCEHTLQEAHAHAERLARELAKLQSGVTVASTASQLQLYTKELEIRRLRAELKGYSGELHEMVGIRQ